MFRLYNLQSLGRGRKVLRRSSCYQRGSPQVSHSKHRSGEARSYSEDRYLETIVTADLTESNERGGMPRLRDRQMIASDFAAFRLTMATIPSCTMKLYGIWLYLPNKSSDRKATEPSHQPFQLYHSQPFLQSLPGSSQFDMKQVPLTDLCRVAHNILTVVKLRLPWC